MVIERVWLRWLVATLAFVGATWLNMKLQPVLDSRAPLMPYFPALVMVGLTCGLTPALVLLLAACMAMLYWWIPPAGQIWPIESVADGVLLILFFCAGLLVSVVSAWAGRLMQKERLGRRRLNLALAAGRMVTWDWDVATGFATTAGGVRELFGTRWKTMDDMLAGLPDDVARDFRERYRYAVESGGRFSLSAPMTRGDNGEVVWVQIDGYVTLDTKGRAAHAYGVAVDVTTQQEALRASQAAEERFHLALQSGKVMAWECDTQGRYTWAYNIPMGISREALIGAEVGSLVDQPQYAAIIRDAVVSGDAVNLAQQSTHNGNSFHLLTSLKPVRDADGQVRRVLGATVDVTELTAAQEQLRRESQRKDAFLATLAHELRNPMAPIRYAVTMLRQARSDDMRHRATDIIARQSAHMARLLDDLLDMSRITRNVIELKRQIIDVRSVVRQALEAVEPLYSEMRHRVSLALPEEPVMVDGDPTRLQQVLANLLDNAAKYSPIPGEVRVDVEIDHGHAKVKVTDTGIGIAMAQQPQVFELFTRLDAKGAGPSGLGIGLAVSRQLVLLHGGTIHVESEGAGHGSRFIVCLPLVKDVQAPAHISEAGAPGDAAASSWSVLVVDDNADAADTLSEVLQGAHYRTAVAYSGEEALACFTRVRPRVVLLDIGLPGLSGLEVARRMRAMSDEPGLILVAITGWGQHADREATTDAGFDAHLVKPIEFNELERTMQKLLHAGAS
ncbi:PAS domain S-box-containing protein [Roseateles sp. YR242]|uniref:hybrid sensor histidine kinase/response regulator n=1 Tax=Roseateles sp. YR242 TaxID=1855305 RepID=UPI0008B8EDF0|nr:ATP-binding protein [Roseateles sp. YR242]SEK55884.1 PAS domain S-box-containing protein [Roseateles sp. YR242]